MPAVIVAIIFRRRAFFKEIKSIIIKIKPIMKKSGEYDVITQSIEISSDVIKQDLSSGDASKLRAYVKSNLAFGMAKKLIKSGYITETWIKKEYSEECTLTLYVRPLIEKKD